MFLFDMGCEMRVSAGSSGRKDNFKNLEFCNGSSDVMSDFSDK